MSNTFRCQHVRYSGQRHRWTIFNTRSVDTKRRRSAGPPSGSEERGHNQAPKIALCSHRVCKIRKTGTSIVHDVTSTEINSRDARIPALAGPRQKNRSCGVVVCWLVANWWLPPCRQGARCSGASEQQGSFQLRPVHWPQGNDGGATQSKRIMCWMEGGRATTAPTKLTGSS